MYTRSGHLSMLTLGYSASFPPFEPFQATSIMAADVDMPLAEPSPATSRRQHLGQTFEAYRAELDDDASICPDLETCADRWLLERIAGKTHHPLAINHPAVQETHLPPPPRGQCPARPAPEKPHRGRGKGEGNCRSVQQYQARVGCCQGR